jgi:hypothetical protein
VVLQAVLSWVRGKASGGAACRNKKKVRMSCAGGRAAAEKPGVPWLSLPGIPSSICRPHFVVWPLLLGSQHPEQRTSVE